MRVGARMQYSGPLYRDSAGNGKDKTVSGTYTVKYYYPGRKCGVHVDGLGVGSKIRLQSPCVKGGFQNGDYQVFGCELRQRACCRGPPCPGCRAD